MRAEDLVRETTGMTNTGRSVPSPLARLRKRLDRERKARLEAEALAEKSTRALYDKQQTVALLQTVAAAANEAEAIEDALQIALNEVCAYTGWPVGHAYMKADDAPATLFSTTIWHLENRERFETFRRVTEATPMPLGIGLPGRVFASGRPAWIMDVTQDQNFPRAALASDIGVRAGFGFPVLVGTEVVAVLEFFSDKTLGPNERLLEIMRHVGTQLGRVVERKRAEREMTAFTAKLARSNRELQDFASVASHDLREPLRKIRAFGDRLTAKCADALSGEGRDYLERMQKAAQRMENLIDDLLTFARVTTNARPFALVDLTEVVNEVLSDLEVQIGRTGGRVEVGWLPAIEADPTQMRQLFQNLISNALKFHRDSETPIVRVYGKLLRGQCGDGSWNGSPEEKCQIAVEDNGIGFDEKYLDRIFTVFQRLHGRDAYEGTGIGLAVCRKIVERHAGSITASSRLGKGATFFTTLPVKSANGARQP